jgi:DNA-binding PadR family transcriptional regulator
MLNLDHSKELHGGSVSEGDTLSLLMGKRRHRVTRSKATSRTGTRSSTQNVSVSIYSATDPEEVAKQLIDLQILFLLRREPHTLYTMKKSLGEAFGSQRSFGTIHPHLEKLESLGLIKSRSEGGAKRSGSPRLRKRIYSLTAKGRAHLRKDVKLLSNLALKMAA